MPSVINKCWIRFLNHITYYLAIWATQFHILFATVGRYIAGSTVKTIPRATVSIHCSHSVLDFEQTLWTVVQADKWLCAIFTTYLPTRRTKEQLGSGTKTRAILLWTPARDLHRVKLHKKLSLYGKRVMPCPRLQFIRIK